MDALNLKDRVVSPGRSSAECKRETTRHAAQQRIACGRTMKIRRMFTRAYLRLAGIQASTRTRGYANMQMQTHLGPRRRLMSINRAGKGIISATTFAARVRERKLLLPFPPFASLSSLPPPDAYLCIALARLPDHQSRSIELIRFDAPHSRFPIFQIFIIHSRFNPPLAGNTLVINKCARQFYSPSNTVQELGALDLLVSITGSRWRSNSR